VGDAAGELAHGLHLLHLAHLGLRGLAADRLGPELVVGQVQGVAGGQRHPQPPARFHEDEGAQRQGGEGAQHQRQDDQVGLPPGRRIPLHQQALLVGGHRSDDPTNLVHQHLAPSEAVDVQGVLGVAAAVGGDGLAHHVLPGVGQGP
jgi:hypothetical protein